jgi:hypothetical protein
LAFSVFFGGLEELPRINAELLRRNGFEEATRLRPFGLRFDISPATEDFSWSTLIKLCSSFSVGRRCARDGVDIPCLPGSKPP